MDVIKNKRENLYRHFSVFGLVIFASLQASNTNASFSPEEEAAMERREAQRGPVTSYTPNRTQANCETGCSKIGFSLKLPAGIGRPSGHVQ
jgi:hypothetical protein